MGPNDDDFGPRFPPMDDAYHLPLRQLIHKQGQQLNMKLTEGVYISVLGPMYETEAEINAFRMWGADVIGMSTVPEVIVANHCGLKVGVIATITNYATGMTDISHDHNEVVEQAKQVSAKLCQLVESVVGALNK